jgi:hypothetical protein
MDGSLLLTLVLLFTLVFVVARVQSAPPGSPWSRDELWNAIRTALGAPEAPRPRPAEYFTTNIPKTWPIRGILVAASDELQAMRQALVSARAVRLPAHIIRSYDENMRQACLLLNRNGDRIVQAARTGPVSPQLHEALMRKQHSLQRLLEALQLARGSLAAVIVTGLEDQRDLDRVTNSLEAWSEALIEVSAETSAPSLPPSVHEA